METYSHSKISLRGVIDSKYFSKMFHRCLWFTLIHQLKKCLGDETVPKKWRDSTVKPYKIRDLVEDELPDKFTASTLKLERYKAIVETVEEMEEEYEVKEKPRTSRPTQSAEKTASKRATTIAKPIKAPKRELDSFERMLNEVEGGSDGFSDMLDEFDSSPLGSPVRGSPLGSPRRVDDVRVERDSPAAATTSTTDLNEGYSFAAEADVLTKKLTRIVKKTTVTIDPFAELVAVCYAIVNISGVFGEPEDAGAAHIYDLFKGKIPSSLDLEWLESRSELHSTVLHTIRLTFKLCLDAFTMGEMEFFDEEKEFLASIVEVESEAHLGGSDLPSWGEQIRNCHPQLIDLGYDDASSSYSMLTLSLQDEEVMVGELDREVLLKRTNT